MKSLFPLIFLIFLNNTIADDLDYDCLREKYLDYTKSVNEYWLTKDSVFKRLYPDLHKEFSYLNFEQIKHNRMQEITIDHLIALHRDELKMDGSLYNMVPRYKHYAQEIYRELRGNSEFNLLYLDIESYKKENKMPDYNRLKKASEVLVELDENKQVKGAMKEAVEKSQKMVGGLGCRS